MKWWLISAETADEVLQALKEAHRCLGSPIVQTWRDAIHSLESGLHETDAVPRDFKAEVDRG